MSAIKKALLLLFIFSTSSSVFAETVTMTTYYPAPSGNYNNLTTNALTTNSLTNGTLTITNHILFSTGGQNFFSGINGGTFYLNAGGASAATGISITSGGLVGVNKVATVPLDVNGNAAVSGNIVAGGTLNVAGVSTLAGLTATSISSPTITATTRILSNRIDNNGVSPLLLNSATRVVGILSVDSNITAGGSVTASFYTHSDERLKENIIPITGAVQKVQALTGVYFKYKGKDGQRVGLIAQNVEKIVPEVVMTGADDMKSVDYSSLVAVLIEAVKEQQDMINGLKADIEKMKNGL